MTYNTRTTDVVLKEKFEDRGWHQEDEINPTLEREPVAKLPFSEEEYQTFARLLAKLALQDQDKKVIDMYFELQRRADFGNGYARIANLEAAEKEMWGLGTGEEVELSEKTK